MGFRAQNVSCFVIIAFSTLLFFVACGEQGDFIVEESEPAGIYARELVDVQVFREQGTAGLGIQILGGEPILFFHDNANCVYQMNPDGESRLLTDQVPNDFTLYDSLWRETEDGAIFAWRMEARELLCFDAEGTLLERKEVPYEIRNLCGGSDGQIYVVVTDRRHYGIAEWDSKAREIDALEWTDGLILGIGCDDDGKIYLTDETGIFLLMGLEDVSMRDVREYLVAWENLVLEPTEMESLWVGDGITLVVENRVMRFHLLADGERSEIILRTVAAGRTMGELITRFNSENERYQIVLEELPEEMDADDFRKKTSVEIATGFGPDLFMETCVDDMNALIEKGAVADLAVYEEQSEIRFEEYSELTRFPFENRGGMYGISYGVYVTFQCAPKLYAAELSGSSAEEYLTWLTAIESDLSYRYGMNASSTLRCLLETSTDLFGMVDWENRTCDFTGELFSKLIEICSRYGENGREREYLTYPMAVQNYDAYAMIRDTMVKYDWKIVAEPGNFGNRFTVRPCGIAMNSGCQNKDGAWEFLEFLLREDNQELVALYSTDGSFPVSLQAVQAAGDRALSEPHERVVSFSRYDGVEFEMTEGLTRNRVEEVQEILASATPANYAPSAILDIIEEESQAYFEGFKTVEQIGAVIQSRVSLYLME